MSEYVLGKNEEELCGLLKHILTDRDEFVATMLFLTIDQLDPEGNCKQLIDFIKNNPNVGRDEVIDKSDEILGIEDPFADEEN